MAPLKPRVTVEIEGRPVQIRAWQYQMKGVSGFDVPVFLLDADVSENSASDRKLTNDLYGGDQSYRLCQEAVLGLGGVKMLRALGYEQIVRFHLNEGHAALLVPALLAERSTTAAAGGTRCAPLDLDSARDQSVFTTHTPVSAGHDQFPVDLTRMVLGEALWDLLKRCGQEAGLNMTDLALRESRYINGVAMKHGEVSQSFFPGYPIHSITNGCIRSPGPRRHFKHCMIGICRIGARTNSPYGRRSVSQVLRFGTLIWRRNACWWTL